MSRKTGTGCPIPRGSLLVMLLRAKPVDPADATEGAG